MPDGDLIASLYRASRERTVALLREHPGAEDVPVAATPRWTVRELLAHLLGVAEDAVAGWAPTGGITEEWTEGHVRRAEGVPAAELLDRWERVGPSVEDVARARPFWPLAIDAGSHEHDLRAALGDRGARDSDMVRIGGTALLRSLSVPAPLVVETEGGQSRVGPEGGEPAVLRTTMFETFRWRMGRRSRAQMAAMDWTGDPEPFLDHLHVFGPSPTDIVE